MTSALRCLTSERSNSTYAGMFLSVFPFLGAADCTDPAGRALACAPAVAMRPAQARTMIQIAVCLFIYAPQLVVGEGLLVKKTFKCVWVELLERRHDNIGGQMLSVAAYSDAVHSRARRAASTPATASSSTIDFAGGASRREAPT